MDPLNGTTLSNTENEAELLLHLEDIIAVKWLLKEQNIHTDDSEPINEETQDVFVNTEDSLTMEEDIRKKKEPDYREEYPMDYNSTVCINNESDPEIPVNSNTLVTDTDADSVEFTGKQAAATNKTYSNTPANKPHTCTTCSKSFISKAHLKRHVRIHTGEKPYKCDTCDKCFSQKVSLLKHMLTHTGENPFKCDRCDKCFRSKSGLVYLMRTHTGEKPYKCDRCDKCYSVKHHLLSHIRTHASDKPYKCDRCKKCFNNQSSLLRHIRTHSGAKFYY